MVCARTSKRLQLSHDYEGHRAYAQSKLALIAFGFELAKRLDPAIVTVNSLHPATYMPTKIVMQSVGNAVDTIEDGITATARLIEDPALDGVTGRFFDQLEDASAHRQAYEPAFQEWLWNTTMRLLGRSDTQK
jgi:NAD(P)-dependent dehydrogenase (short-subunit alcohol dehydrogenase family)